MRAVRFYRNWVSPALPGSCRFYPTCSAYAHQALEVHGAWRGSLLTGARLLRCHPFHRGGYDPVPENTLNPELQISTAGEAQGLFRDPEPALRPRPEHGAFRGGCGTGRG